ncbi:SPOSA6832_01950 [Sporobolomyces salmonicolor]|uniref:SPOSA6832_01950-mRNA-1:cds n=1 Tax=Sporidiobolus salmonicolor TaxID=5005 RepID=A0A0D6EL42_SPOSA|nr:SPOSA6832_01950 [Sporobolomyces salmonicolor]
MGLADRLGLSRTATFVATVHVHELLQVPLVNAKFRIKWRFKGATTTGAAAAALADSDDSSAHPHLAHLADAGKRFLHPRTALRAASSSSGPAADERARRVSSGQWDSDGADGVPAGPEGAFRSPSRSPPMSPSQDPRTPNPNLTPGLSSFPFTSPFAANPETLYSRPERMQTFESAGTAISGFSGGEDGTFPRRRGGADLYHASPPTAHARQPEPKGSTTFIPLRSHTATFNRDITCAVQIPLRQIGQTGRYQLQPSPVRLAIKQEVIGDDGKKEERTGVVVLDLSQFVHSGRGVEAEPKARRYLLQDCKTNAVLKVTVKMEWIDGERDFVAPTLRSGQVVSSSAAAKSLASSSNSPANRSSASLLSRKTGSPAASSQRGTNSFSGSSGMARSTSTVSSATSSVRTEEASPTNSAAPSRSSKDRDPSSRVVGPNGRRKGWHPPSSAFSSCPAPTLLGGSNVGERNASDIIETIFNRPARTPRLGSAPWSGSRPDTLSLLPGGERDQTFNPKEKLSEPMEVNNSSSGKLKKAGKAWSIRSGRSARSVNKDKSRGKSKDQGGEPPSRQGSLDVDHSTQRHSVPHASGIDVELSVQPPTPDILTYSRPPSFNSRIPPSFASTPSTNRPPPPSQPPPPRPPSPSEPSGMFRRPSLSASSTRALSVRWGDDPNPNSSMATSAAPPPPSITPTSRPQRRERSNDECTGSSAKSTASVHPGLGLATTERGGANPPSRASSFTNVVTPPSPKKQPPTENGAGQGEPTAPGGNDWGKSWD